MRTKLAEGDEADWGKRCGAAKKIPKDGKALARKVANTVQRHNRKAVPRSLDGVGSVG